MNSDKKHAFYTLGCRANQFQTEILKAQFAACDPEDEICVINTCAVTHDAERKSKQAIRRAARQNPKARIMAAGCLAKTDPASLRQIAERVEIINLDPFSKNLVLKSRRVRSNLMIQDGCEHFCAYCIVPFARGGMKSKPLAQILEETYQLVQSGTREIILTGINLAAYGRDTGISLEEVIKELSPIPHLLRIRLSSLEPMYLNAIPENPKICRHFHLPLQSGDNKLLSAMGRNYTAEKYADMIKHIRAKYPSCGISTDIIAGFPGEGEKEFQNTVDFIKQINFSRLHIFSYSKRKGTKAADMPGQIRAETKKERSGLLQALNRELMFNFAEQYLNREVEILAEQKGEGLTSNYIRCFFNDPQDSSRRLVKIHIHSISPSGALHGIKV